MIENIGAYSQVDYDRGYKQGKADSYKEITTEYMLLSEKQVEEIREDAIFDVLKWVQAEYLYLADIGEIEEMFREWVEEQKE